VITWLFGLVGLTLCLGSGRTWVRVPLPATQSLQWLSTALSLTLTSDLSDSDL
jgi:hypothetical protein